MEDAEARDNLLRVDEPTGRVVEGSDEPNTVLLLERHGQSYL
jgi:hypothetical protein